MREVIKSFSIELEGITPVLLHKCVLEKSPGDTNVGYQDEWIKTTYLDSGGHVIWPGMNMEATILAIPRTIKLKNQMTNKTESAKPILTSGVQIREFEIPFIVKGKKIKIDDIEKNGWLFSCPAVVNRARIIRTRTCLPRGWCLAFTLDMTNPAISDEFLKETISNAGWKYGIGDCRPGSPKKPGKFGQFIIAKWEQIE